MKKFLPLSGTLLLILLAWTLPPAVGQVGYQVVVHSSNPVSTVSKEEISGFLLKKKSRWAHGETVDPADLDSQSSVRATMSKDIHGRSVASIKNYWQRQIFSGRNVPPPEVGSDAAMIDFVKTRPGAIGYVSADANVTGVKVLQVID